MWSVQLPPLNIGLLLIICKIMQPTDQTSIEIVHAVAPKASSGE
jgi:hypothetical protein